MSAVTIALDAMGGDHGPKVVVPAALHALKQHPHLKLILVGDQQLLRSHLQRLNVAESEKLVIHHASEVVTMDEQPALALRNKKDSSMRVVINLVKENLAQACVSAGNTGALMATARFVLKTLPGIDRPAILGVLPNRYGRVHMLDLGANVDSTAENLFEFAVMASVLVAAVENINNPRVALLNVGQEDIKGNEVVKQAAQLIQAQPSINYIGFVEGDDIFSGEVDIIVCDGFVGNVALKTTEGSARLIKHFLKKAFTQCLWGRVVGWLSAPIFKRFAKVIDPARYNGASLVGLRGIVIKSHGSASVLAYARAIDEAILQVQKNVPQRISKQLSEFLMTQQENPEL